MNNSEISWKYKFLFYVFVLVDYLVMIESFLIKFRRLALLVYLPNLDKAYFWSYHSLSLNHTVVNKVMRLICYYIWS